MYTIKRDHEKILILKIVVSSFDEMATPTMEVKNIHKTAESEWRMFCGEKAVLLKIDGNEKSKIAKINKLKRLLPSKSPAARLGSPILTALISTINSGKEVPTARSNIRILLIISRI